MGLGRFKNKRDKTVFVDVREAFTSQVWFLQLDYMRWLSEWLTKAQEWIGGCTCHEADLLGGVQLACSNKGRRMPEAYGYVVSTLRAASLESESWSLAAWDGNVEFWTQAQGMARGQSGLVKLRVCAMLFHRFCALKVIIM